MSLDRIDWQERCKRCGHLRREHSDRSDDVPPGLGVCMSGTCRCPHFVHQSALQPIEL